MNSTGLIKTHGRVVSALIVREMSTRFGNKAGGYLWAVLDPVGHIVLMTLVFSAIARTPPLGTNFALFFASGYLAMQFWQSMAGQIAGAISANKALLAYPIVSPIDVIVSRFTLQFLTTGFVTSLVIAGCMMIAEHTSRLHLMPMIEAAVVAAVLGLGIGMMNIVLFKKSSLYEKVYGILTRPMFIISGVFFLPESIPQPYRDYLLINPIAHVIMWFRTGIYPYYQATDLDRQYVMIFAGSALLIGFVCFTTATRTLRS